MAKRKIPSRKQLMAESWFGVSHVLPLRSPSTSSKLVRAYEKTHKAARENPTKVVRVVRSANGKPRLVTETRGNPYTAKSSKRTTHPENCPIPLASSILDARRDAKWFDSLPASEKKKHASKFKISKRTGKVILPVRFGNCDYRSAAVAMSVHPEGTGTKFSGTIHRGKAKKEDPEAEWTTVSKRGPSRRNFTLRYWAHKIEGAAGDAAAAAAETLADVSILPHGWWTR